jgi:hypothetical protein
VTGSTIRGIAFSSNFIFNKDNERDSVHLNVKSKWVGNVKFVLYVTVMFF